MTTWPLNTELIFWTAVVIYIAGCCFESGRRGPQQSEPRRIDHGGPGMWQASRAVHAVDSLTTRIAIELSKRLRILCRFNSCGPHYGCK